MKSPFQQQPSASDKIKRPSLRTVNTDLANETTQHLIGYIDVFCNETFEGIIVLDHDARILYLNPAANEIFATPSKACLDQIIWNVFPDLDNNFKKQIHDAYFNTRAAVIKGDYPSLHKSLAIRAKKTALNIFIFIQDITPAADISHHNTMKAILFNTFIANMCDGMIVLNQDGIVLSFNPAAETMTGFNANEVIGRSINLLMDTEIASKHNDYMTAFESTYGHNVVGRKRPIHMHRKDKSSFPVEIALAKIELEGETLFIGTAHDITERIEQEKKIKELARFPEENRDPVLKISAQGEITYTNPQGEAILRSWDTRLHSKVPEHILQIIQKSITENDSQQIEVQCEKNITFSIVFAPAPDIEAVYVYGRDITHSTKIQQELIEHKNRLKMMEQERTRELQLARDEASRSNQAKSLLLANMSHEMRTPLTTLIGKAEILFDDDVPKEERLNILQTIIGRGRHLQTMINGMLDLSKIEAEALPVNIFDVMRGIHTFIEPQAKAKGLQLNFNYELPLPKAINTDPRRLKQILINLCSNAIKFTEKGTIKVTIQCQRDKELIYFEVSDTGIGMTDEQLNKIFESSSQADTTTTQKYGGTGTGLSLSKQLTMMMGGDLVATSEINRGSTFILILPTGSLDTTEFTNELVHPHSHLESKAENSNFKVRGKILLVEDTPEIQGLVSKYISKAGANVMIAENGKEAIEAALVHDFDLIFMDIQMPIMEGFNAVRTLRQQGYDKPIIAMMANAIRKDREKCMANGFDNFIYKPIQRDKLYRMISEYLTVINAGIDNDRPEPTSAAKPGTDDVVLLSTLLEDEPDLVDLIEVFLQQLPAYIGRCTTQFSERDWSSLAETLHSLIGMAGGYGYQSITDTARMAEDELKQQNYERIPEFLAELEKLNDMAQRGYKKP